MRFPKKYIPVLLATGILATATTVQAANFSDTYIAYRYGNDFREPNNPNDVSKNILQFTHGSSYNYGQNFLNVDVLKSDSADPANNSSEGATEIYLTYRGQLYLGKIFDKDLSFGPVKEVAITAGFDVNTKNTKFAPSKRLLVIGPTLKLDVPIFWDVSLLWGREQNHCGLGAPACPKADITFDPQAIFATSWLIPFQTGPLPLKFQGFLNIAGPKGPDYAGIETKTETLMRTSLMLDVGKMVGGTKNTVWLGIGYEYWRNKFGNHYNAKGVEKTGINTSAPTLQAEWHF